MEVDQAKAQEESELQEYLKEQARAKEELLKQQKPDAERALNIMEEKKDI